MARASTRGSLSLSQGTAALQLHSNTFLCHINCRKTTLQVLCIDGSRVMGNVFHRAWQAATLYSCDLIFSSLEKKKAKKTSCKPRSTNTCSIGTSCLFQLFMTTTSKPCFHLITQPVENLYTSFMGKLLKSDSEKKQTSAARL